MASSSSSVSYDLTSGQDAAHKMGQERSKLEAQQYGELYGGNVQQALMGANRIRDIQKYLAGLGTNPYGIEQIPYARPQSVTQSNSLSDG